MTRSILAVVAGFAAMSLLVVIATAVAIRLNPGGRGPVHAPTPTYLVVNLCYSALAAVLGGFLAALLAGRAPLVHAGVLAAVVVAMSLVSMKRYAGQQPMWYQITLLVLMPTFVLCGGLLLAAVATSSGVRGAPPA
ncbi:MAG: hypothetical protein M3167_10120 [Acidobacteriota bacterium]|nr:hypothetical protein [Acidobacteriota bacterium]